MLDMVNRYVAHKRGLGYKLKTESYMLRAFARQADRQAPGELLTTKMALKWATEPKTCSRTYHAKRLDAVRSFARYLAMFRPRTEIPPSGILGPSFLRVEPHIYTSEEIAALMHEASKVTPRSPATRTNSIRNATVIGLLSCTGMRIGEVLALKNEDVDLAAGVITVRESKRLPMRLIPIMDCAVRQLRRYLRARDSCFDPPAGSGNSGRLDSGNSGRFSRGEDSGSGRGRRRS
jgi:site-specific recombinase XerD